MAGNQTALWNSILNALALVISYILGFATALIPTFNEEIRSFLLKPNLILDGELTLRPGDPNRLEHPELVYCLVNLRNEPPKGWLTRRGRASARNSEIWLKARRSGESKSPEQYQLLWPFHNNPTAFDIPNDGRPYRVVLLHFDQESKEIKIPTGPPLGQGKYRYSTLSAGTYDLTLEVGPPTQMTKASWHITLPDDVVRTARK